MSLNLEGVPQDPTHRNRAIGTLTGFSYAFILCGLALMGEQNNITLGVEWPALWSGPSAFHNMAMRSKSQPEQACYLEPTQAAGRAFVMRRILGEVVMLNLLRFREIADYSATPNLAPKEPISGAAAFDLYIEHTLPFLRESGGELLFLGAGGPFLIGPEAERWDLAMLVRQTSVQSFLAFASNEAYLAGIGHRTAALEDSRLLPLAEAKATKK
jgi:hypothetical protein